MLDVGIGMVSNLLSVLIWCPLALLRPVAVDAALVAFALSERRAHGRELDIGVTCIVVRSRLFLLPGLATALSAG